MIDTGDKISIFLAGLALCVSYFANRYQIIGLLNAQMSDRARECNSSLSLPGSKIPREIDNLSHIISSIITCEEILNNSVYKGYNFFTFKLGVQVLIDNFYLQLHTSIRDYLKKETIDWNEIKAPVSREQINTLNVQYKRVREFLAMSIVRDGLKTFEKLHEKTLSRNGNLF